jgi:CRISPR-associated protein Csx14
VAEASVPVDLFNPGQVFACLGLTEAAEVLLGDAEGAFDWSDSGDVRFRLRAGGVVSPVVVVLEFLARAKVFGEAPDGSPCHEAWKAPWGKLKTRAKDAGYPFPDPPSPATVVCTLSDETNVLTIDHYGDETNRDNVKFWAGSGGYPGVALARDALDLVRTQAVAHASDPFSLGLPQSSSFRLDWRRDYIPIDAGFSLNAHGNRMGTVGFPLVELLGALGLSHARPERPNRRNKLEYVYGVAGRCKHEDSWLPPAFLRAALGGGSFPFPTRRFRMLLGWPGKEGQARSITTVTEETTT